MKMSMFVVAFVACTCSSVFAGESRTWTGGGTGWGDAASWGGETPPAAGDKAIIPDSLTASVADGDVDLVAALGEIEVQAGGTLSLANAGKALALSAKLVGSGALVADGSKGVTLSGDNEDFDGPTTFSNTPVTVTSRHGLGAPTRAVAHTNNRLLFKGEGLTNDVPLEIVGNRNAAATYFTENQTDRLVFNGEVKFPKTIQIHLGDWEFNGGVTFVNSVYAISTSANCHPVIRNKPMKSTSVYMPYGFGDKATLTLAAPTNTYQSFAFVGCAQQRDRGLVCGCTNALRPTTYLALGRGSSFDGTLNLNGYDQTVTYLRYSDYQKYDPGWYCVPTPTTKAYGLVFSDEKPATVTMTGAETTNANWRVAYKFSGKVSLTKQGVGTYTIVNQYSDTTGKLRVEEGAVVFDWSAG